jgi:uncharacterized protein YndB with AHSA1/START domain
MTVTSVQTDREALVLTLTAHFDAPVERVWQLWANPRLLERWWGPPTYPATFVDHDLKPGGHVTYFMTGPEGDRAYGWWRVVAVDAPNRLDFEDGFADDTGTPNPDMPTTTMRVSVEAEADGRTRMIVESRFPSREAMDQMLAMGMEEGLAQAVGQIDALLQSGVPQ